MKRYLQFVLLLAIISLIGVGCIPSSPTQQIELSNLTVTLDSPTSSPVAENLTPLPLTSLPAAENLTPLPPTSSPVAENLTPVPPISNAIYFGSVEDNNAIFVISNISRANYENYFPSYEYLGKLYFEGSGGFDFNFRDIENPTLLFSIANNEDLIRVSFANGKAYVSGVKHEPDLNDVSFVYAVNLETGDSQEVWTGMPGYVDRVVGSIIIFKLYPCYHCGPGSLRKTIIINAKTGTDKELGEIGDVTISFEKNTVSYRNLIPLQVPCDSSEYCADGFYLEYETAGEFLVETLP